MCLDQLDVLMHSPIIKILGAIYQHDCIKRIIPVCNKHVLMEENRA